MNREFHESMNDKEIVFTIMQEHFNDNDTFSMTPKGWALIGLYSGKSEIISENPEYKTLGEIEFRLLDRISFEEEILSRNFELNSFLGLRPIIRFLDKE